MKKTDKPNTEETIGKERKTTSTRKTNQSSKKEPFSSTKFETYLLKIQKCIGAKKTEEASHLIEIAEKEVNRAVTDIKNNKTEKGNVSICFFFSLMELSLYSDYYQDKSSDIVLLPYDYVSLLSLKGQLHFLENDHEGAKGCLHEAMKFNPVCTDLLFLDADINHAQFNWFSYMMDLDKVSTFLHKESDFRRYYRYLSTYYKEYESHPELAKILDGLGNEKEKNTLHQSFKFLTEKQKNLLDEYKIPYDISKLVLDVLVDSCRQSISENMIPQYKYFHSLLSQFRNDKDIIDLID